jgi:30S ribosome assembly GTPase
MDKLLADLMQKGAANGNKIHVMGAANVGKSSFINRLLDTANEQQGARGGGRGKNGKHKSKPGQKSASSGPMATVSPLPGTTLNFLKIKLPNGITMVDTPGLLQRGQLTSKLTTEELKQVIPSSQIQPSTLRVTEGKCVLLGGLAKVELLEVQSYWRT